MNAHTSAVTEDAPFAGLVPVRYRFDCVAQTQVRLPDYAGSLLRGAFGHALRQVACITREKDCAPCPLKRTCPYTVVFAPGKPEAPHPRLGNNDIPASYVIEPPQWGARMLAPGDKFGFHMVLIGRALEHLPIVILAWRRAFARGIGAGDGIADLLAVRTEGGDVIYTPEDGRIAAHEAARAVAPAPTLAPAGRATSRATLHFITPLRLQENGHALSPQRLTPRALILAAARRGSLLAEFHGTGAPDIDWTALAADADAMQHQSNMAWRDWTRFSSRQKQAMTLGGAVGEWVLEGSLDRALPWLHLGQWLHVGKETVFGLGGYRLEYGLLEHNSRPGGKIADAPRNCLKEEKGRG